MPLPAPVITATLFANFKAMAFSFYLRPEW
jgi:hypothetical protein